MNNKTYAGYIAIIGRPNVGKSTLLNAILGKKISITSRKPQTTRQQILGVKTLDNVQMIFVDTPGLHNVNKRALNRYMNRAAMAALTDVDLIIFVVTIRWDEQDEWILQKLKKTTKPVICVINKIDELKDRESLLVYIEQLSQKFNFYKIIPISAKTKLQLDDLEKAVGTCLPEGHHFFPAEQITDRSETFMAAEILREKLTRLYGKEVPYALSVGIEAFVEEAKIIRIAAIIWVEREGQKAILIGKQGERLKLVGQKARLDMEKYFGKKVFLQTWVKVKENWSDDDKLLKRFGYEE